MTAPPRGLYLHVPFCVSHCPYCDFVVVAGREARGPASRVSAFVRALHVELGVRADALDARWGPPGTRPALATLYLGGGTPSLLPTDAVAGLIATVRARFGLEHRAEVTLEVNPGPDERGDAGAWRDAGVTRVSIGAQSMDQVELRTLGRRHAPGDVAAAVAEARAAGIGSVSVDLLYDVPGQSLDTWSASLDAVLALQPDHVSAYALTLDDPDAEGLTGPSGDHLPTRRGARQWRDRARTGQDDDRAATMYELADARLTAAGLPWYEISNWAREGHRSRHNLGYWRGTPWEAAGPGAHAFDGAIRRWNAARLDAYVEALTPRDGGAPSLPPGGAEASTWSSGEGALLGLRTADGLPSMSAERRWAEERLRDPLVQPLLDRRADGRLALTLRGRLLSNEVFTRLL